MFVDAHTHRDSSTPSVRILSLEELRGNSPLKGNFAAGIHPWDLPVATLGDREHVQRWAKHPQCVAVGETGLDRARRIDWEAQVESLRWHWELAEQLQKPLVLHCVRSSSDLLFLLKQRRPKTPWQWHDFSGPINVVSSVLKLHPLMHFSFSPRGVRRSDFRALWESVPAERRLLETDDSGATIEEVYRLVQPPEDVLVKTFQKLFALTVR